MLPFRNKLEKHKNKTQHTKKQRKQFCVAMKKALKISLTLCGIEWCG